MTAWSDAHGTPALVLAIPPHAMANLDTCPAQFPNPALCASSVRQWDEMLQALTASGLPWVDGLAAFRATGLPHFHPPGRLDPDHPNAAGHAVLAAAAVPAARAALGLPADSPPAPDSDASPSAGHAAPGGARNAGLDAPRDRARPTPRHPGGGRNRRAREDPAGGAL